MEEKLMNAGQQGNFANENVCDTCNKKSANGDKIIVYTAEGTDRWRGNIKHRDFSKFHRIRVFVCSDCKKDGKSLERATGNKDTRFGRVGSFSFWREADSFEFINSLWDACPKQNNHAFIKDLVKDELEDKAANKSVALKFHAKKTWGVDAAAGKIYIDGILVALCSFVKGFDITINTTAGEHRIAVGITRMSKDLVLQTKENQCYEFDCNIDRMMGGIKLTPRSPSK